MLNFVHEKSTHSPASWLLLDNSLTRAPLATLAPPLRPHPPSPGLLLRRGCFAGRWAAPGGALCGLGAADLQAADEDAGVAPPRGLGQGAGAAPPCFGSGRDVKALNLPQLLPPAAGRTGSVGEGGGGGGGGSLLDGGTAEEAVEERRALRGGRGGGAEEQ